MAASYSHMHIYTYTHIHIYTYTCHRHIYIYTHIHIYTYTHIVLYCIVCLLTYTESKYIFLIKSSSRYKCPTWYHHLKLTLVLYKYHNPSTHPLPLTPKYHISPNSTKKIFRVSGVSILFQYSREWMRHVRCQVQRIALNR